MPDNASREDVARLFGRVAFGATAADLDTWTGRPYAEMVASLFPPGPPGTPGRLPAGDELEHLYQDASNDIYGAQRWWLERMRTTPYPLEERLTLFWHDHFATAFTGQPDVPMVIAQNKTFRQHAFGSFRALANAMTIDGAMLYWLNGISNHKDGVNENFAREFLELFTLGTVPQVYTETDIREAAKAFTGWNYNTITRLPEFFPARHDSSVKTVLGRRVGGHAPASPQEALEYTEITEAVLAHDNGKTVSRFIAWKLVQQLGYEVSAADAVNDLLVQDVAWAIRANDKWDLGLGLRTLLTHPRWRYADPAAGRRLVRPPIDVLVHAGKVLAFPKPIPYGSLFWGQQTQFHSERTGQVPFLPPNVGGWPHGTGWLAQTTNLGRYDVTAILAQYWRNLALNYVITLPPSGDITGWTKFMGLASLSTSTRLRVQSYLADPGTLDELTKQLAVFVLLATSPDWQVM